MYIVLCNILVNKVIELPKQKRAYKFLAEKQRPLVTLSLTRVMKKTQMPRR